MYLSYYVYSKANIYVYTYTLVKSLRAYRMSHSTMRQSLQDSPSNL